MNAKFNKEMKPTFIALLALGLMIGSGCASVIKVPCKITSTPAGARVEVNGVYFGRTPVSINLSTSKKWVGVLVAPGGWAYDDVAYRFTVYPPTGSPEQSNSQTKVVRPHEFLQGGQLLFDFRQDAEKKPIAQNPSLVPVQPIDRSIKSTGTGFFITDDGYILTNHHVIDAANSVSIKTAIGFLRATVVKVDKLNDLAVLKVEGKFKALPIVSSRKVGLGDEVFTLGFPQTSVQGFSPKLRPRGQSTVWLASRMTRAISKSACPSSRGIQAGRW
jgi:S1-C subfamily serine protease